MTCESNEVYIKILKKTTTYASEESFNILSGTTTLYSSPTLVNADLREIEACLAVSQNYQYTLAIALIVMVILGLMVAILRSVLSMIILF